MSAAVIEQLIELFVQLRERVPERWPSLGYAEAMNDAIQALEDLRDTGKVPPMASHLSEDR